MDLKNLKDRVNDALETENPSGVGYYGTELDEAEVEADRKRIDEKIETHESGDNKVTNVPPVVP